MKVCCICHRKADGDEATCPACGEASWSFVADSAPVAPSVPTNEDAPVDAPEGTTTTKKRGRR